MNISTYKENTSKLMSIAQKALDERVISQDVYDNFVSRIQNNEFRITIVGEFSSGKSTLIDALIGKDILPHSTSETTATLTYIHSIEPGHVKENKAEIFFSDGNTKLVDFSTLKEYVTAFSKTVDVFSSIEYVNIYVHIENFDNNIVIVDTPGLNGTNHYEDRTLQEIAKADASIFVFSPSGIKATEQSFMKEELLKHQKSFFFVMNRIDDLRKSEGESVESKLDELADDISLRFFDGKNEVTNIFGVSALKALAAKDHSIEKLYVDDCNNISDDDRARFWKESRFELFLNNLKDFLANEKETVFVNSLSTQLSYEFDDCLQRIEQSLFVNQPKEELPAATIVRDEINTAKSRFENYENGLEKNVNARMDNVEKNLKISLANVVMAGMQRLEEVKKQIDGIKTIDEFYNTFGEDGSKASSIVNNFYDRHYEGINRSLADEIMSVRNEMFLEIRNLIPNIANIKKANVESVNIGKKTFTYNSSNNSSMAQARVKECEERIDQLYIKQGEFFKEKAKIDDQYNSLENQANKLRSDINSVNYRISALGRRPDAQLVTCYREVRVERSKWNPLRWFGDKYTTESESYTDYDYSDQEEYDRKKSDLKSEKSSLNRQLSAIQRQIDDLPDMESQLQRIARDIERQLKEKDYQLNEVRKEEEAKRKEMEAGREAFLNSRKKALINMLQSILTNEQSELHRSLKNDSLQSLKELRGNLVSIIRDYFKTESSNYINQLNVMLSNISSAMENEEIEQKRHSLTVSKNNLLQLKSEIEALTI
ncbi:MAG: dynamin family protein [Bacteroidaceae bacterium]|nr:dynamin family protein [Bacteroidaceae bacterium]